jgi:hypothetical protein
MPLSARPMLLQLSRDQLLATGHTQRRVQAGGPSRVGGRRAHEVGAGLGGLARHRDWLISPEDVGCRHTTASAELVKDRQPRLQAQ